MADPQQQHLYSTKVRTFQVTLFVDPPSMRARDAKSPEDLADVLALRIMATITDFGVANPDVLVAVT